MVRTTSEPGDRRNRLLRQAQSGGRLHTVVAGVFDRDQFLWRGADGPGAHLGSQYRIGSITKTFTAVLVMRAQDAGMLRLDDSVSHFLGPVGYGEAKIASLLSHTSGMQSEPSGSWWERSRGVEMHELLERNDGSARVGADGEYFHYSNLGYGLLGAILERVHCRSWRDLVQTDLLDPLGMRHTSFLPRPSAQPGFSVDHFSSVSRAEPMTSTGAMAPAGQLWSTVGDLALWARVLSGSEPGILSPETVQKMSAPVSEDYGLGLMVPLHRLGRLVGHSGSMPGYLAALYLDPTFGLGSVVLTNSTTGIDQQALALQLIDPDEACDDETEASATQWTPTRELPASVNGVPGLWFWGNSAHELRWCNEQLEMLPLVPGGTPVTFELQLGDGGEQAPGRSEMLIGADGYHRGERLQVHRRADGSVHYLECATFIYTREPYDPSAPIPGGAG